jgi:predicted TPR repeat methyltransferase
MTQDLDAARAHFAAGVSLFEAGRFDEADGRFAASLALLPERGSTLVNLGATRIKRGLAAEALPLLEKAVALDGTDADAWSHRGVALADLGRPADALASHERALALDATRHLDLFHRGVVLNVLDRHSEALLAFESVLALRPEAEAWFRHGQTLQLLDRHREALVSYQRALADDPTHAQAWSNRGGILRDLKQMAAAAHSFRQALAHGADAELHRYFLASVGAEAAPAQPPPAYVASLFDHYADGFDEHLVQALRYQAHTVLVDGLAELGNRWFAQALDLGCGTGLCAPLVKPRVGRLDGVDLSRAMLDRAASLQLYDRLVQDDVGRHLQGTSERYDLVLSADVFIYVGDLAEVFAGVQRVLEPGGVFCFSVERAEGEQGFELRPSLRYAHSEPYLRQLAARHELAVARIVGRAIREDQARPVDGLFVYLEKR